MAQKYPKLSEATIQDHDMTLRYLIAFFGEHQQLDSITSNAAEHWLDALAAGRLVEAREKSARGKGLIEQTIRGHIRNAKTLFGWAKTFAYVPSNPLDGFSGRPLPSSPKHYVTVGDVEALLKAAHNYGQRALFALCRLAGLRLTEARTLPWSGKELDRDGNRRWVGVDWNRRRVCLVADKTHVYREVPITPRLHEILMEAFEHASEGQVTVTGLSANNLHRNGEKAARAAGLTPWKKFYQAMRTSCENDWKQQGIAEPTYNAWIGHSSQVSRSHYVSPTDDEFALVTKKVSKAKSA